MNSGDPRKVVFMAMVRHGERCDNSNLQEEQARIEIMHDAPLTHLGVS